MLFDDLIEQYLLVMGLLISNAVCSQCRELRRNSWEDLALWWGAGAPWARPKRVIAVSVICHYSDVSLR